MNRRSFLRSAVVAAVATTSACFGSFPALRWVWSFNKNISGSKFIQWLVFLVLIILPVYGIAGLIDIWILNSLEFWFGGSPVSENEQPEEKVVTLKNGEQLRMRRDRVKGVLEIEQTGGAKELALAFQFGDEGARVLDRNGHEIARAGNAPDGGVRVFDANGVIEDFARSEAEAVVETYQSGGATQTAAWAKARSASLPSYAEATRPN